MSDIWYKIAHTSGAKIYGLLLGIASIVITARWLGPEGRGELAALTTWAMTLATLCHLSLGQVAIYRAGQAEEKAWLQSVLPILATASIFLTLIGWLIAATAYWWTGGVIFGNLSGFMIVLAFSLLPLLILEQYVSNLLQAINKITISNQYYVLGRTVSFGSMLLMVPVFNLGVLGFLLSTIIGQMITTFGGFFIFFKRSIRLKSALNYDGWNFIKNGLFLHLNTIGTYAFNSINVLILNFYKSADEVGFFQVAVQMMGVILVIPQSASNVVFGKVVEEGPLKSWGEHRIILFKVCAFMLLLSVILAISAPYITEFVLGPKFLPVVDVFRLQLIMLVGMAFCTIMAAQWIVRGYFKRLSLIAVVVGSVGVAANFWLIPAYGMYGATWASLGAYSIAIMVNVYMFIYCEKEWRRHLNA